MRLLAILTTSGHVGEIVELSGPSALTQAQVANVLARRTRRAIQHIAEDPHVHAQALREAGTPEGYITWRMAMLGAIRTGAGAYLSDRVTRALNRPGTDFEAWAAR